MLRDYKEKSGSGILHFNNPYQLLDRLELLGGSILAENDGVIPEFFQITHLHPSPISNYKKAAK